MMALTTARLESTQERSILGTAVGFPDAMRFKGAAPEIINSRCVWLRHLLRSS